MTFTYDGGLVTEMAWSGVTNGTYRYRYDNNFSLVGMQLDDQPEIEMKRDADGLLTQYGQFQIVRNQATGAPNQMTDGRMKVDIEYDNSGRVISRTNQVNGKIIYQLQLSYDQLSRIVQKRETVVGKTQTYDYTYDLDGQLILVKRDGEIVERYVYDDNGNRTEWQLENQQHTASYDAQDRLIELDGTPYEFDADGFLIQRGDMTLKYSATGELLEVSWPDGKAIQYTYDSMNRRVARTDEKGTDQYLYGNPNHPFQVTAVRDNSGKLSVYEYDDFGSLFALKRDGNLYYVATDQLGTPRVVCDVDGQAIKVLDYNSFGQQIADSNSAFDLPINFAGGLIESNTELVRFGFRDYDFVAGKWTAKDPIGFAGNDTNLYRYVQGNPINFTDPSGLVVQVPLLLIAGGVVVGAVVNGTIYSLTAGKNFTARGLTGAAVAGGITGGVGVVAVPLAVAAGWGTGLAGVAVINGVAGLGAAGIGAAIDPNQDFTLEYALTSAGFNAVGGAVGQKCFATPGMSNFKQVGFPRTLRGIIPKLLGGNAGPNAINSIYRGGTTSAGIGAVGPVLEQGVHNQINQQKH